MNNLNGLKIELIKLNITETMHSLQCRLHLEVGIHNV